MNDSSKTTEIQPAEAVERQGWYSWWSSKTGTMVAVGLLVVVAGTLLFGQLSSLGIWEPWEADEILAAREYAERGDEKAAEAPKDGEDGKSKLEHARVQPEQLRDGADAPEPNWATPTIDGRRVTRPLLKTWLISWSIGKSDDSSRFEVGKLERSARLPIAVSVFLLVLLVFFWIKSHFDTWSALLASVVLVSAPAVFFGAHTLSTGMLFVVVSSLAVMAYFQLAHACDPKERWLWGALLGVALSLSFLELRFWGLVTPLAVIVGYAVTQLPFEQVARARANPSGVAVMVERLDVGLAVASLLGAGGVLLWGLQRSADATNDVYFLPHVLQWIAILVPSFILLAGLFLARRTRAVRSLIGGPGALAVVMTAIVVALVTMAYGDANPLRRIDGEIAGKIPLLTFLLENHLTGSSLAKDHLHFAMWVRQLGFSLLPWVALVPLGVGYCARAARLEDDDGKPLTDLMSAQSSFKRLLLVWGFMTAVVVAASSGFDHYYYAGYLPLLVGVGLMLGDVAFWKRARLHSLVVYAMGFVAVATIMMLGKDLERFPDRFMEAYLVFQEDLELPDDFSFGKTLKAIKYGWAIMLATFFFGLASWAGLTLRTLRELPGRFRAWRARRKAKGDETAEDGGEFIETPQHIEKTQDEVSPLRKRAWQKEAYRAEEGLIPALARLVELPSTWGAIVAIAGVATAGIFLFSFAPKLSAHLSQQGIFQTYTEVAADDEPLYRHNVSVGDSSVYLGEVPQISRTEAFVDRFDDEERFFVVIPRDRLAAINYDIRKRFGRDLPVLDDSSSRLLLASNKLEDGEEQKNFISKAIVDNPKEFEPEIPLRFAKNGRIMPATYDDRLELIGWNIDRKPEDGTFPTYKWGEKAKLTFYFRVKKRISGQQKIFMHVDYPGSRIHGDHEPANGDFPTNYWLPGDIVKDEYELNIDSYSSPGIYTIWMGFYRGSRRMQVEPKQAHDGDNRVLVGKIEVEGML
ncbi:phospholipid carrier-dependent glycosyltransferase [Persicimonas caeni]|uniref:Phospholipid carrier-dependent glycosyltransferase n=1 Tax=Persicimonas caeni TaxID=2292766 RepID=A0A4Y6PUM9_PERCE|nr:glycosyltransferase family 39 protein [Persicimonas caeni]QDG52041.1 phospholipid carrier-dependent glycosyltransferase [Persicimonas caeni]QED33262.1 phospholipid carrier-dependent glycosyltransferase [Persicimonas caeni]